MSFRVDRAAVSGLPGRAGPEPAAVSARYLHLRAASSDRSGGGSNGIKRLYVLSADPARNSNPEPVQVKRTRDLLLIRPEIALGIRILPRGSCRLIGDRGLFL